MFAVAVLLLGLTGCTAVGILGKVTETGHGLIISLQDATEHTWGIINGWTSVTTYAASSRLTRRI